MEIDLAALFSQYLPQLAAEPCPLSCEVETEVFLIAPDAKQKDARVIRVTKDNCYDCLTIWKDSDVFEVGPLFRCYQFNPERTLPKGTVVAILQIVKFPCLIISTTVMPCYYAPPPPCVLLRGKRGEGLIIKFCTSFLTLAPPPPPPPLNCRYGL